MQPTSFVACALLMGMVVMCAGGHMVDALGLLFIAYIFVSATRGKK
jgi:hypothetical protein